MDKDVEIAMSELRKHKVSHNALNRKAGRMISEKSPFMGRTQVEELIGLGRTTLYNMIADGDFPAPKKLGKRAVGWSRAEVDAWIKEKLQ